jgi:hypothetical protein
MPTIEIASINATKIGINQEDFNIAIREEIKLESHRGLFYDFLIKQSGTIIHIGNPNLKNEDHGFFADKLINWDFDYKEIDIPEVDLNDPTDNWGANQQFVFQFLDKYRPEIDQLLKLALRTSPISKIFFLTDYQFGPEHPSTEIIFTITDFWDQHDNSGLKFNRLYEIYGE